MKTEEDMEAKDLVDGRFYTVSELSSILKNLRLPFSIFKIRELERSGVIPSPRTSVRIVKGYGHRRYTKDQILKVIKVLEPRT